MRIVSLLPSTTEIVSALGLDQALVGITHECDFPPTIRTRPVVTRSVLDHTNATSYDIDQAVSKQLHAGLSLYELDEQLLHELQPQLILTQELCEVCAVSYGAVRHAVRDITLTANHLAPQILSLEPHTLDDILATIEYIGAATATEPQAQRLVANLRTRIDAVRERAAQAHRRPRVACIEWIDPLFGPGHWLPEMIEIAGGEVAIPSWPGGDSRRISWDEVLRFAPEVVVVMPCGFGLDQAVAEAERVLPTLANWATLPAVQAGRVFAADGNALFSRPGPRMVDSLEILAELIHPELFSGWGLSSAWATVCTESQPLFSGSRGECV